MNVKMDLHSEQNSLCQACGARALWSLCLKRNPCFIRVSSVAKKSVIFILVMMALSVAASDAMEFTWNQANARMATAESPAEFMEAAQLYRDMIDRGVHNGAVFYNYGTALLFAEAPVAAVDALRRAEIYAGASAGIRRNKALAEAAVARTEKGEVALADDWLYAPLFWHYAISLNIRIVILLVLYNVLWVVVPVRWGLRRAEQRAWVRRLRAVLRLPTVVAVILLVLFATSVAHSLYVLASPMPEQEVQKFRSPEVQNSGANL